MAKTLKEFPALRVTIERMPWAHDWNVVMFGSSAPMLEPRTHNNSPARAWSFRTPDDAVLALQQRFGAVEVVSVIDRLAINGASNG